LQFATGSTCGKQIPLLLGLTATPERMEGGGGVADPVSVEDDRFWQAGRYNTGALEAAYVDHQAQAAVRLGAILAALDRWTFFAGKLPLKFSPRIARPPAARHTPSRALRA